jgi:NAD(P)-dependent dehydrogenase (short-subunit alcohol dehydrogenase family)
MHSKTDLMNNKNVVITGAASGIGKATVKAFLEQGTCVIALDKNQEALDLLVKDLAEFKNRIIPFAINVADELTIVSLFQVISERFKHIDVLVNNAGILQFGATEDFSFQDWKRILSTNIDSMFLCSQQVLKLMLKKGHGSIINISSTAGLVGSTHSAAYVTSKHAVIGLTKALAIEYADRSIRVNAICPGDVLTLMSSKYTEAEIKQVILNHPIKRLGKPEEIADVAVFLASEQASFMTGSVVSVDGGYTAI